MLAENPIPSSEKFETRPEATCPLCNAAGKFVFATRDRLHPLPGLFYSYRCSSCEVIFLHPFPTDEELSQHYPEETYYAYCEGGEDTGALRRYLKRQAQDRTSWTGKVMRRVARWRGNEVWELAAAFREGSKVLDIGCGSGDYLAIFQKLGLVCFGLERSSKAIGSARQRGFQVSSDWEDFSKERFDLILLRHTLEHLPDPKETLARCHHLVNANGQLVITVPSFSSLSFRLFGAAYWQIDAPRHLFCYPVATLEKLASASDWAVKENWTTSLSAGFVYSLEHWLSARFPRRGPFYPGGGQEKQWHKGARLFLAPPLFLIDRFGRGENVSMVLKPVRR